MRLTARHRSPATSERHADLMTAAWLAAWAAVATALIYVALGIFAAVQVLQARATRQLTYRPYVVVDFEFRRFLVYISIKNIGQTPATDVSIVFDQPLQTVGISKDPNKASVFSAPIPMVAPGRNIRVTFGVSHRLMSEPNIPDRYKATVTYRSMGGKQKQYTDQYVLDFSHYADAAVDPKGLPELVSEVGELSKELRKWTDGTSGLLIHSVNRDVQRRRQERPYQRAESRRVLRDKGLISYVRWLVRRQLQHFGWQ